MKHQALITQFLPGQFNNQARLVEHARHLNTRMLLQVGDDQYRMHIRAGRIESATPGPFVMNDWDFSLCAEADVWSTFWLAVPPPGFHDLFALLKFRRMTLQGNLHPFMSNLLYFKSLLATPRHIEVS
ncbi:hypothetical protein [Castellaniella sp.]|uniref:hypothetical protein n=1 Tax=Castellaniella sp. TaxID=1955812 RepID=UPI00355D84FB